jgi:uncharacterized protein YndB with AHSA1/START domain
MTRQPPLSRFGHLTLALEGDRTIRFTRTFAAPRPLVWRAMTEPALVTEWLWARDYPMVLCEMDLRVGGGFRWGWQVAPGKVMAMSGRYLEIEPPGRIVHTELFDEDWTDGETTVTLRLVEDAAATRMEMDVLYPSSKGCRMALATPMADGMEEGYARLDGLLPAWR